MTAELKSLWNAMIDATDNHDVETADRLLIGTIGQILPCLPQADRTLVTAIVTAWEAAKDKRYATNAHPLNGSIVDGITGEERLVPYRVEWHKVYDEMGEIGDLT